MDAEAASLELLTLGLAGCSLELDDPWNTGARLFGLVQAEISGYLEHPYSGVELPRR
jgi:hypothetical protein